ncbi:hypothetical protein B0H11DRAFT_2095647 [Mycena galericulata]|nr:hypothetical protein B0H11DRAFT_2095647 [Mycena galericulata]
MTRSSSPNGAVEFSYDFPVASTSALPSPTKPRTRTRSPVRPAAHQQPRRPSPVRVRPRWEMGAHYDDADEYDDDDEIDYDAYGYPAAGRRHAHALPIHHTGNQWHRTPSPLPLAAYPTSHAPHYAYSAPLPLAPSSCESTASALSSCSRSTQSHAPAKKIRKPAPAAPSTRRLSSESTRSPSSSPASSPSSLDFSPSDEDEDAYPHVPEPELLEDDADEDAESTAHPHAHASSPSPHSLRRQWAALSLRVRFGVFRAKRRMRARVMSL